MSNSEHPLLRGGLSLVLGPFCWADGFAAPVAVQGRVLQAAEIPADDYVSRARELVRTLYPNLDPNLRVVFQDAKRWGQTGITNLFHLQLSTYTGSKRDADGNLCDCEKLVLLARVLFDPLTKDRELTQLVMIDPARDDRQKMFGDLIGKHGEWSETQVIQAMKEAGAKYGPDDKDQLLRSLPLAALEPYIGQLKVEQANFVLNRPEGANSSGEEMRSVCFWRVTGTSHFASGATWEYIFVVDAFEGRLRLINNTGHVKE